MIRLLTRAVSALALVCAVSAAAAQDRSVSDELSGFIKPTPSARLAHLEGLLKSRGLTHRIEEFQGGGKGTPVVGKNVVITLGAGQGKAIVLSAHYDAVQLKDGTLVGGVVDNAGSVLALLNAAERLAKERLTHPVRVLFTDQEELGLIGSRRYVEAHGVADIAVVINFDINGNGDTVIYGLPDGKESIGTLALRDVCAARALECLTFPNFPPSDERSFSEAKVPVVSIAHLPALEAHQLWLLLNAGGKSGLTKGFVPSILQTIHTQADNMNAVEPATVERATSLALDLVRRLDRGLTAYATDPRLK